MALTNKGVERLLRSFFRSEGNPNFLYLALVQPATPPTEDTQVFSELTEVVSNNNGYVSGGMQLEALPSFFDTVMVDDINDQTTVTLRETRFVAEPNALENIGYVVLLGDGAVANRDVLAFWPLSQPITVPAGQTLSLTGFSILGGIVPFISTNGSGNPPSSGLLYHEKWSGGLALTYTDTELSYSVSWSRQLSIDGDGSSRVEAGAPLRSNEVVNNAYVGAEVIDFNDRKVLDMYVKGDGTQRDLAVVVPLIGTDNWQYDVFAQYPRQRLYVRYFTYIPSLANVDMALGSSLTIGEQVLTTEPFGSPGYLQRVVDTGSGLAYFHLHQDPTSGANTLIKQTTTEPTVLVKVGSWQQHDLEILMDYRSNVGYVKKWVDNVLVFESLGIMGDDPSSFTPDVANFALVLRGDVFEAGEQHLYIGDVIIALESIR